MLSLTVRVQPSWLSVGIMTRMQKNWLGGSIANVPSDTCNEIHKLIVHVSYNNKGLKNNHNNNSTLIQTHDLLHHCTTTTSTATTTPWHPCSDIYQGSPQWLDPDQASNQAWCYEHCVECISYRKGSYQARLELESGLKSGQSNCQETIQLQLMCCAP